MTREQVLKIFRTKPGFKITHIMFAEDEYLYAKNDGRIYDENYNLFEDWKENSRYDGMRTRKDGVWADNWQFFEEEKTSGLTIQEALEIFRTKPGVKVSHRLFSDNEYLYADESGYVYDEKGNLVEDWVSKEHNKLRKNDYGVWEDGWHVFDAKKTINDHPRKTNFMTLNEMLQTIKNNHNLKISHTSFDPNEYIYSKENGIVCNSKGEIFDDFCSDVYCGLRERYDGEWEYGWYLYDDNTTQNHKAEKVIGAKEFRKRIKAKLKSSNPEIDVEDLYFSQLCIGYTIAYKPNYPDSSAADFIISQDLCGMINLYGNLQALVPTVRRFKNIEDFESNL